MAFGQASGPPATARQVQELLELLHQAGHADFRDARGPMGFTQRQAAGKFTRDEVAAFIEQLQQPDGPAASIEPALPRPLRSVRAQPSPAGSLERVPAEQLAAELQRRGWMVIEPLEDV